MFTKYLNATRQNTRAGSITSIPTPLWHGPLTGYVKLQVAHAPGMPGTFSPAADFKGNRLLAIPACITARASRTCHDACRDRLPAMTGKTFPAFPAHAHPQFFVTGKRPMFRGSTTASWLVCHRLRADIEPFSHAFGPQILQAWKLTIWLLHMK